MTARVGLFGGSFDPVHDAHLALAEAALAELRLDQVHWIPAGQPWQKTRAISPAADREAMLRLAIAHEPRFVLDRIELEREGPSFTVDTVRALAARLPGTQWFLLIGQDQYASLHTWRDWQTLLGLVVLAVANRPGENPPPHPELQRWPHRRVSLPMLDISSTVIRERARRGDDITDCVPGAVARYIETHGLYRHGDRDAGRD